MDKVKDTRRWQVFNTPAIQDAGLISMRIRNELLYNPLLDESPPLPEHMPDMGKPHSLLTLWNTATILVEEALWILSDGGLRLVERYKCDHTEWIEFDEFDAVKFSRDFPARFHKAFKIVRRGLFAICQYGQRINGSPALYPSPVAAARAVLWPRIDDRITDSDLYMILALANLVWAFKSMRNIANDCTPFTKYPASLIEEAREWIDTGLVFDEAEASKRRALEAIRATHESDPDKLRGRKVADSASKGGLVSRKWPQRADEMQAAIDGLYAENPSLSYEGMKRLAKRRYGFPLSALKRYTTNPIKKELVHPRH